MPRDPRHDILFEPVQIGPKRARNRLWQASHCMGGGAERPGFQAEHRAVKAEGGWAVVGTEYTAIAPESEDMPRIAGRLWDQGDVRNYRLMTERAHENGALASVQLWYGGPFACGGESRMLGVRKAASHARAYLGVPVAGRAMSKEEIREVQQYYVRAARLARDAGFDIVCLLCSTAIDITHQFLLPALNNRTDEYGGGLENRARFALETYEQVREAVGDDMAITVRLGVDTLDHPYGMGDLGIRVDGDGGGFMELADDLIDMWDLVIGPLEWGEQAGPSRTHPTNWARDIMMEARGHTKKLLANVGRLTDPGTMVEMIESGQCDVIAAARPTISDPYLPQKIDEGRLDDIRECIGCNMCISKFEVGALPIVCTQNATIGEEYRRGWHPEKFTTAANADKDVLVIGAGPAGMECARILGERGMNHVHLVEADAEIGGHVKDISALPRLGEWGRVINYRQIQLDKLKNVELITGERLTKEQVLEYGAEIVIVATGSYWSTTGVHDVENQPIPGADAESQDHVLTPDQVFAGKDPGKRVVVFDTDGYFLAATLAERFAKEDREVTFVTPLAETAPYTEKTLEQPRLVRLLRRLGVTIHNYTTLGRVDAGAATLVDVWDDSERVVECDGVVLVTQRVPHESLFQELRADPAALEREGIEAVYRVGDCAVPSTIADAVFEGHRLAREIDSPNPEYPLPYIRERRLLDASEDDFKLDSPTIAISMPQVRA
ncbi:MAG: FAD-dependent oxidoreductase [Actinobacteria bacterium]|nr:FAD-dependent oxidoreductase [Actinomycetota bacterium]